MIIPVVAVVLVLFSVVVTVGRHAADGTEGQYAASEPDESSSR